MTQPTFVPISEADQVRPARHLHVPGPWTTSRPAEISTPHTAVGRSVGSPGPDAGFALRLVRRFEHDLKLAPGESEHDVLFGVALVAAKRAAVFGRAPCIYDVQFALQLWGFLGDAPAELVAQRGLLFSAVSHDYVDQPALVDSVDEATYRSPHALEAGRLRGLSPRSMPPGAAEPIVIDRLEIDANGLRFMARAAGPLDGRRVILLHGFPQTSWCWRAQLVALAAAGYRAIAPDQRGYSPGARPADVADYSMACLLDDLMALSKAMEMETFDLVGHDWGAMVGWQAATHFPERVRSLAAVSTPHPLALQHALLGGDPDQANRASAMDLYREFDQPERLLLGADGSGSGLRSLLTEGGLGEADAAVYVAALCQPGAMTAALNWYRAMDRADLFELTPVAVPTLYVWSTGDAALGRTAAEATRECVTGLYEFAVLDGVSHWIPETAPRQLNELLLQHLART